LVPSLTPSPPDPSGLFTLSFFVLPQAHVERCPRLGLIAEPLEPCSQLPHLVHQLSPLPAVMGPLLGLCRAAGAAPVARVGMVERPDHALLPLTLAGRASVIAPHMISRQILHVLPVEAQEFDGLGLPPGIGGELLIRCDATGAELLPVVLRAGQL